MTTTIRLGKYVASRPKAQLGAGAHAPASGQDIAYTGDSHLLTIAPTGAGKGRSAIIPTLLTYDGPVVVIDPKGENYAVTARYRRSLGHHVLKLDPFGVVDDGPTDAINPFDIFALPSANLESEAQMFADLLSVGNVSAQEPFWDLSSRGLLSGVIAYVAAHKRRSQQNFSTIRSLVFSRNISLTLGSIVEGEGDKLQRLAFDEFAAFLQLPDQNTRPSVHATACSYLKALSCERVLASLHQSSASVDQIRDGAPLSIYLVVPPDKLRSHQAVLRLWIGTLLRIITSRRRIPRKRTLFILDECAQLGSFAFLETVISLCRGYGLQAWTFWQDLSQLKKLYPLGWPTMINNCDVLQLFGVGNHMLATEFAALVGMPAVQLRRLASDEQVIVLRGRPPVNCERFDYLHDPELAGRADANPFYATGTSNGVASANRRAAAHAGAPELSGTEA